MRNCPDCDVKPGEYHKEYCDVCRCSNCGGQAISCGCTNQDSTKVKWTGMWPGEMECNEYNFWCYWGEGRWVTCDKLHPKAQCDLNRLYTECVWDKEMCRMVLKNEKGN